MPVTTYADDLVATIRQEIMKDPRTAQMSPAQIDQMVHVLTVTAQKEGITAHDMTWRPPVVAAPKLSFAEQLTHSPCSVIPFACAINMAFGFDDSYPQIPLTLALSAMALIAITGLIHHHHHTKHDTITE